MNPKYKKIYEIVDELKKNLHKILSSYTIVRLNLVIELLC